jgi:hypothetical protein
MLNFCTSSEKGEKIAVSEAAWSISSARLKADLSLPAYTTEFSYPAYRAEQLQDICNKAIVIYGVDSNTWGIPLGQYIIG